MVIWEYNFINICSMKMRYIFFIKDSILNTSIKKVRRSLPIISHRYSGESTQHVVKRKVYIDLYESVCEINLKEKSKRKVLNVNVVFVLRHLFDVINYHCKPLT